MPTNLPPQEFNDSADGTRLFFDRYGVEPNQYRAVDIDAAVSFFESAGFDREAAVVSAITILQQAKREGSNVFTILDSLQKLDSVRLSQLVAEILNNNRVPTSALGYRAQITSDIKSREIGA